MSSKRLWLLPAGGALVVAVALVLSVVLEAPAGPSPTAAVTGAAAKAEARGTARYEVATGTGQTGRAVGFRRMGVVDFRATPAGGGDEIAQYLRLLSSATDVRKQDRTRLRGRPATRYSVEVSIGRQVPVDVWITNDGLPSRIHGTFTALGQTLDTVIDLFDYGVPPDQG